jgi:citronellol/citronellal dehydrogenase
LQRFGTEAEVSAAIVFLLSPAASFITGSCIRIDGGAPNARRGWWKLQPAENNEAFNGFHRSTAPEILNTVPS